MVVFGKKNFFCIFVKCSCSKHALHDNKTTKDKTMRRKAGAAASSE